MPFEPIYKRKAVESISIGVVKHKSSKHYHMRITIPKTLGGHVHTADNVTTAFGTGVDAGWIRIGKYVKGRDDAVVPRTSAKSTRISTPAYAAFDGIKHDTKCTEYVIEEDCIKIKYFNSATPLQPRETKPVVAAIEKVREIAAQKRSTTLKRKPPVASKPDDAPTIEKTASQPVGGMTKKRSEALSLETSVGTGELEPIDEIEKLYAYIATKCSATKAFEATLTELSRGSDVQGSQMFNYFTILIRTKRIRARAPEKRGGAYRIALRQL